MGRVKSMFISLLVGLLFLPLIDISKPQETVIIQHEIKVVMPEAPLSAADLYLDEHRFIEAEKYSDEEIDLLARVAYAEACDQSEYGIRLVIDVILNRIDDPRFKENDIHSVVYARNQFEVVSNGMIWMYNNWASIRHLVVEELCQRTNTDVIAFRMGRYHTWATPAFKEGDHYFSI